MSAACPVYGFLITLRVKGGTNIEAVRRALESELVRRGLVGTSSGATMTVTGEATQATDADRQAVIAWLENRRDLQDFTVGALDDVGRSA